MPAIAAAISALAVLLAFRLRALTADGALLAFLVGFLVLAGSGWAGGLALGAFFISSSLVSRRAERHEPAWFDAPGNRRNARQVAANGGVAALGGLAGLLGWPETGLAMIVCSLSAAAADTWATSWGIAGTGDPIDIWRWRRVPRGTSGGVSLRGTIGGLAGAALVAGASVLTHASWRLFWVAVISGVGGMLADSLLGSTLQGHFYCSICGQPSERRTHSCGTVTQRTSGRSWLGNDGVNFLSTALAGLAGVFWSGIG